jgi:RNA polymerase sigma-70 factor, ECF subfamily
MDEAAIRAALRSGDEAGFAALVERHRRQLLVHCYRMVGSLEEAEDLVQETFLRAWRGRADFEGRSLVRTWLYRIATNVCLLATIQFLSPRQRAILLLRDVLGWSAKETAGLLESSVDAVNSALRRARSTMRNRLPRCRLEWAQATSPTDEERAVLQRFVDAHDRADVAAFAALLREDVRQAMPPHLLWYEGRDAIATRFARYIDPDSPEYPGQVRLVPTVANRQPAAVTYLRRPDDSEHRLAGLNVLDVEGGLVVGIVSFESSCWARRLRTCRAVRERRPPRGLDVT